MPPTRRPLHQQPYTKSLTMFLPLASAAGLRKRIASLKVRLYPEWQAKILLGILQFLLILIKNARFANFRIGYHALWGGKIKPKERGRNSTIIFLDLYNLWSDLKTKFLQLNAYGL